MNQQSKLFNTIAAVLSGVLLGLSFPPFKTFFLVYPGLIILLHLIVTSVRFRHAFRNGYVALVFLNIVATYWIGNWWGNDVFLKIAGAATMLAHPLFMAIPLLVFYGIYKGIKKDYVIFLFPFIWVGYEYLDNVWELSFPWLELGNTETYNLNRIQYADLAGVHGVSFVILLTSVILYFLIVKLHNRQWKSFGAGAIVSYTAILVLFTAPYFYSINKLNSPENSKYFSSGDPAKQIKTAIIQPNIDPNKKWTGDKDSIVDGCIKRINDALKLNPDLIVLHETAVPYYFFEEYNYVNTKKFLDIVNNNRKYLLIGIPHIYYYPDSTTAPPDSKLSSVTRRRFDTFNSAVLLEPGKKNSEFTIHEKVKLVPFSERAPYVEQLPFLSKWIRWGVGISAWQRGTKLTEFVMNNSAGKQNTKFITLICFESVFSDYVREGVKNGAEFISIITNDGWFGNSSGPVQHDRYAVLRAIENRKWIVRAAQTGISDFIDPLGNQYEKTELETEALISKTIIANNEVTFYDENGDIIGKAGYYTMIICLLLGLILYAVRRKKSKLA